MLNAALAFLAGALIVWLVLRARMNVLSSQLSISEANRLSAEADAKQCRVANSALTAELAAAARDLVNEKRGSAEKLNLLTSAQQDLKNAFQALAADALSSNNASFLQLATTQLTGFQGHAEEDLEARKRAVEDLVAPIKTSLSKVDAQLSDLETERGKAYSELKTQVESLASTQVQLRDETGKLVAALRSPSVRGRWGEIQLRRVVELAGMVPYCDFVEQQTVQGGEGRLRPDLIVNLPGGKKIVVDAKTALDAYLDAVNCNGDERQAHLQRHARQVRDHMAQLSLKSYWEQFEASPEFVVMFLPGEMFFSAALEQYPTLIEEGVNQGVIPASPTTLIALLRAVAYGWSQEKLARNAEEISRLGKEMYERLRKMTEHFEALGKGLNRAVESYNSAMRSLEARVLVSARRFSELGVSVSDEILEPDQIETTTRTLALDWDEEEPVAPVAEEELHVSEGKAHE
jgi:DNA recombination protein RmuC